MSTTLKYYSIPENESGLTVLTHPTTAWSYGGWYTLATKTNRDVYITGITFQLTDPTTADVAKENMLEIGIGSLSDGTTVAQIPFDTKNDTAVGYYLDTRVFNFPEPFLIKKSSNILIRATGGLGTINGVKLRYLAEDKLIALSSSSYNNNYKRFSGSGSTNAGGVI